MLDTPPLILGSTLRTHLLLGDILGQLLSLGLDVLDGTSLRREPR